MKNKLFASLALAFLTILDSQFSKLLAQGTAFTYQGRLTDNASPANGNYDLQFYLLDAPTSGNPVGTTNTVAPVPVSNGLFTVTLDFGTAGFDGNARWMEIGVRTNGSAISHTVLTPRQAVTATPYAITASTLSGSLPAGQLNGTLPSALLSGMYSNAVTFANVANQFAGAFTGDASGLTSINAGNVSSGTLSAARIDAAIARASEIFPTVLASDGSGSGLDADFLDGLNSTAFALASHPHTASDITFGTLSDARLSTNVALLNANQNFSGSNHFIGALVATNENNRIAGNGAGLTSLNAASLIGSVPGAALTSVPAGNLTGTIAANNIGAGSITTVMLAGGAVGSNQLASGAVTTGALADGAVTATKVATVSNWFALTIANPTPVSGDLFGSSVAAVGSDRVLIGAYGDNTGAMYAGAAYLFSANGALLTTFTNPTPADYDFFGYSVAAVGSDRVLIGAERDDTGADGAGAAYLFSTNGTLLTTLTNPTPADGDSFGHAVAAVGSDRVLIGAWMDDTGAMDAGAAYLFSTNGTLLTTFTNPTPAVFDEFGSSVAAVGSDRVLIGAAADDTGAPNAGAAYLFSTNGTLLNTLTNPTPAANDEFSVSVAALGSDRVLIGADGDDTGASGAGAAYLFRTETFAAGLVADAVRARSVTTASLEDGAVTAAKIGGELFASQIPDLDSAKVTSGTLADARLSANVALLNGNQTFTGTNIFNNRIGLGLNNPLFPLHIGSSLGVGPINGSAQRAVVENATANGRSALLLLAGPAASAFATNRVEVQVEASDSERRAIIGTASDHEVQFRQNNSVRMTLATSGNVGIGTTSPATVLDVNGTVTATGFSGSGAGLTSLSASSLAANSVASDQLADDLDLGRTNVDGQLDVYRTSAGTASISLIGSGSQISTYGSDGLERTRLWGPSYGELLLKNRLANNATAVRLTAQGSTGGQLELRNTNGSNRAVLEGENGGGLLTLFQADGNIGAILYGNEGAGSGSLSLRNTNGSPRFRADGGPGSGSLAMYNAAGVQTIAITGEGNSSFTGGNVGVGTTNPATMLHVLGGADTEISIESSNPNGRRWTLQSSRDSAANRFEIIDRTANQSYFTIRTNGNVGIGTTNPTNKLHVAGGVSATVFVTTSDRNAKENFAAVDAQAMLEKVAALPITQWNFKEDQGTPHIGPMAQDFYAAFKVGPGSSGIATVDADGVALAAIQGLNQKVDSENAALRAENAELKQRLEKLEHLMARENGGAK